MSRARALENAATERQRRLNEPGQIKPANESRPLVSPKDTQPKKRTEGGTHTTFRTNRNWNLLKPTCMLLVLLANPLSVCARGNAGGRATPLALHVLGQDAPLARETDRALRVRRRCREPHTRSSAVGVLCLRRRRRVHLDVSGVVVRRRVTVREFTVLLLVAVLLAGLLFFLLFVGIVVVAVVRGREPGRERREDPRQRLQRARELQVLVARLALRRSLS